MADYRLSSMAEADIEGIADYTVDTWGEAQALRYVGELVLCFERIAQNPGLGRTCDAVRRGYRRIEQGKHVLFYHHVAGQVLIRRILHQSMLPIRHLMDDSTKP